MILTCLNKKLPRTKWQKIINHHLLLFLYVYELIFLKLKISSSEHFPFCTFSGSVSCFLKWWYGPLLCVFSIHWCIRRHWNCFSIWKCICICKLINISKGALSLKRFVLIVCDLLCGPLVLFILYNLTSVRVKFRFLIVIIVLFWLASFYKLWKWLS